MGAYGKGQQHTGLYRVPGVPKGNIYFPSAHKIQNVTFRDQTGGVETEMTTTTCLPSYK